MTDPSASRPAGTYANARLRLTVGDLAINTIVSVPAAPVPAEAVLPTLQRLVNATVESAEAREQAAGREISCRKGCGACCRQLVPVSRTEARALAALVEAQPADRRAALANRFADAAERIEAAGLAQPLRTPAAQRALGDRELGLAYFALGLACPFLEDESCSIHADRPLACREYLVTSSPENCATAEQTDVEPVGVPKLSVAARGLDSPDTVQDTTGQWLPLTMVLSMPDLASPEPPRPGPAWMKRFFDRMSALPQASPPSKG